MSSQVKEKDFEQMNIFEKLKSTGPAWMAAGLNIGGATVTNSVSLAAATGFAFGWVFGITTLAIFFATYACVKLTVVTGKNPLELIKEKLNPGFAWLVGAAILIVNTVFFGVQIALVGDVLHTLIPAIPDNIGSVIAIIGASAILFLPRKGGDGFLQKALQYMVYLLSLSYIISLFVVDVDWSGFFKGLVSFKLPTSKGEVLLFTSVLGSALAVNVPAIQAYASKSNGYTDKRLPLFRFETIVTNLFLLFVQFAVLIVVTSTLYAQGITPTSALDAAVALEPFAGKFSTILFAFGMFGATFSTMIAETSVNAYVITDLMGWETKPGTQKFKAVQAVMMVAALIIPIFGFNPYSVTSWGAAFNSTFMPIGILAWWLLINKKDVMGQHKATNKLNIALAITILVSLTAAIRFWYVTLS